MIHNILEYSYINAGPHAVTGLTNTTGTLLPAFDQAVDYTDFNKASFISQGEYSYYITYGPDRQRSKTVLNHTPLENTVLTKYYAFGDYEKEITEDGTRHLHYIAGGDGLAAIYVKYDNAPDALYFILKDHLGSIVGAINNETGTVYRQNFDAWGRKRNPVTWSYTDIPDFPFDRGYTGHEHLKWFGLINMNGRMYDAAICRFLSPDSYVQMPDYSQSYNRYSYCLNNPLVYTDPSGEFFIWDSWIVGFVHGFFSTSSNRGGTAWEEANHRANMDASIWGGLFVTDPNKTFGGQIWEIFSRITWQIPQTIGGWGTAQSYNTFGIEGGVESVKYKYGATVVQTRHGDWGGVTQGSFIVGNNSIRADANNPLFQHEYGHYIQSQSSGWAYYPRYALPSLWSKNAETHDFNPIEQDANTRAFKYFNKHITGFSDNTYYGEDKHGWDFWSNPIDPNKTGKRTNHWDYNKPEDMKMVNNLLISPAWYDYASWLIFPIGPIWVGKRNANYYNNQY